MNSNQVRSKNNMNWLNVKIHTNIASYFIYKQSTFAARIFFGKDIVAIDDFDFMLITVYYGLVGLFNHYPNPSY